MTFLGDVQDDDEVSVYMSENIRNAERDLLQTNDGVIDYWLMKRGTFPHLSRVALRLLLSLIHI